MKQLAENSINQGHRSSGMRGIARRFWRKRMFFLYAFIAMLCWGVAPLFAKVGLKETNPMMGLAIRTCVTAVLITGWLFIRGSMTHAQGISWSAFLFLAIEAVFATLVGDWAYFSAVKRGSPAVLEVIMACAPVITLLLVGEPITFARVIGFLLIILGIVFVI